MSRPHPKLEAAGGTLANERELAPLIHEVGNARQQAIARYLAAGKGWRDAGEILGGAFSSSATTAPPSGGKR